MKLWTLILMVALGLTTLNADAAKRLGAGKSVGKQSTNVTQREAAQATPGAPGSPTQGAAATAAPSPAAAGAPATPAKRPWGAMLGGLAAGLGLAWLAHSLGLGGAFGQLLLFGLLAVGIMMIIGWVVRRRQAAQASQGPAGAPFAFQGAGPAAATPTPVSYRPENVGNDASARPWERSSMAFEAGKVPGATGSMIGSALAGSQHWGIPEGFDTEGFLRSAKANFITLQAAWDRSDIPALRAMMTDEMLGEIRTQLAEREATTGTPGNHTDVVMLEAKLLGIEDSAAEYLASVEFSGMIREDASAGPGPFREVWNMTKPKDGRSGWLVAGVQALQ